MIDRRDCDAGASLIAVMVSALLSGDRAAQADALARFHERIEVSLFFGSELEESDGK